MGARISDAKGQDRQQEAGHRETSRVDVRHHHGALWFLRVLPLQEAGTRTSFPQQRHGLKFVKKKKWKRTNDNAKINERSVHFFVCRINETRRDFFLNIFK